MIQYHHYGILTTLPTNDTYQAQIVASYRELSLKFGISKTNILNWTKQPERKVHTTYACKINLDDLAQDIKDYPDAFQRERAVFNCTDRAIAKALKRLKHTHKKSD